MEDAAVIQAYVPAKTREITRRTVSKTVVGAILHSFIVQFVGLIFRGTLLGSRPWPPLL